MDEHTLHDIPAYEAGAYQVIVVGAGHAGIEAALACAPLLAAISPERVFSELGKLLCGKAAGRVLRTYPQVLGAVVPEILPMVGFDQRNAHHCYDVWTHTAVAVDHVPPELPLRLAMLFHDIGKPDTFSLGEDGALLRPRPAERGAGGGHSHPAAGAPAGAGDRPAPGALPRRRPGGEPPAGPPLAAQTGAGSLL